MPSRRTGQLALKSLHGRLRMGGRRLGTSLQSFDPRSEDTERVRGIGDEAKGLADGRISFCFFIHSPPLR